MTERPILFSGPMVRALLDGTKTQTRRVMKPAPIQDKEWVGGFKIVTKKQTSAVGSPLVFEHCPYGRPGDRLWVRENGWERPERTPKMMREGADTWEPYYYDADDLPWQDVEDFKRWGFKRRPSIHMPRWASRITLEITGVRVERLQDISPADCEAEGVQRLPLQEDATNPWYTADVNAGPVLHSRSTIGAYHKLWESINGPGSWDANPWVWVVEFTKIKEARG